MGAGASKAPKNVKVVQEVSPGQQEGQIDGRDVQSRLQGQSNEPGQPGIPIQSVQAGIPTQSGQTGIPTQSGQTGIPTQSGQTGIPTQSGQTGIPSQSQQQGKPGVPTHSHESSEHLYPSLPQHQQLQGQVHWQEKANQQWQQPYCHTTQEGRQQPFNAMQGGGQQPLNAMHGGGQQPLNAMQGGGQQPFNAMQGGGQQPFNAMQGGGQQSFNAMQGGGGQPFNAMQGGGQQPFNAMQGGGQQPFNAMQGGGGQPFNAMQGGGQQPFNAMQGRGQQQFNAMQVGGQQPFNSMQWGGQQPCNAMQGGEQQSFNAMHGGGQQPFNAMQGVGQQPFYTMQGGVQQPFHAMQAGGQQPFNVMHGGGQQPFNAMQGGGQKPFYTMQGGGQQPFNAMQEGGLQSLNAMQGEGQQPFNAIQGGDQQPFHTMQGAGQQPFNALQGRGPPCQEVQGRWQLPSQAMQGEENQPNKEGRRPNQGFPETDKAQEASKPAQSQKKMCHTIHLAVDPDVMEYVLSSSHNDGFQNVMKARQIEINWKPGNNSAVIEFYGEKSESWKAECIEDVQSFLTTFEKSYLPVQKEVWKRVQEQLINPGHTFAKDSPLLKCVEGQYTLTIVASRADIERHKERLKTQIENIYKEATFQKKKIGSISKSHMSLLKAIKFLEHLREKYPEVQVVLDKEKQEIRLQGPRDQVSIAEQDLLNQKQAATKKQLTLDPDVFKILATEEGKAAIEKTLRDKDIEAVTAFNPSQRFVEVLGSSDEHAKKAAAVIHGIVTKQKLPFKKNHLPLMADEGWSNHCKAVQEKKSVIIRKLSSDDIWIVGFKGNVTKAVRKLQFYLDNNAESEEEIECRSSDVKEYLLRCIKSKQESYDVKVRDGEDKLSFYISGRDQGLKKALDMIEKLSKDVVETNKVFRQPGLKTFLKTGDLDGRIKKVGEEENCFIRVEKNLGSAGATLHSHSAGVTAVSTSSGLVTSSGSDTLITAHGHKISWKTGDIANEQADILVIPQGACFNAVKSSFNQDTIQAATQLNFGDISVSSASMNLKCNHVIHCCCSFWNANGEKTLRTIVQNCLLKGDELGGASIAFPVIGTGILRFPLHEASRIMLDEAIKSCEKLQHTTLKDIRFVLYHKDKNLLGAFQQEVMKIQNHGTKTVQSTSGMDEMEIEVTQGNLAQETTDAIVNVIGADLDMNNFGQLSKVIAQAGGPQVQQECNQKGTQVPGSAVMTSGGNLAVKHIIHIVTRSSDRQHLQTCLEAGLRLADSNSLQSISIPAIGTGGFGLSAKDSAQLTFQALKNICGNFQSISKVRIVIYQAQMVHAFQQEQQNNSMPPITPVHSKPIFGSPIRVEVINNDLTRETTDAIVNVIGADLDMNNFGQLSKVIAQASGPQVQQECNQKRPQTPGSAVMTSGGNLAVPHIIHIVTESSDKQHLQTCLEEGLRLADANSLRSISIPAIGTGGFGLSAAESAQLTFHALNNISGNLKSISKVRIVVYQSQMVQAFQQEEQKGSLPPITTVPSRVISGSHIKVDVIKDDLTRETTDAIVNVIGTDFDMNNFGQLSKVIANASGPQVQQECNQKGKQTPGSAVMTSGGNLAAKHIIHIVTASSDKQHLQTCLEEGLRLADRNSLQSISIPAIGTGGFGLSAKVSANVVFQALKTFSQSCVNISRVRIVVFHGDMIQAFQQEQKSQWNPGVPNDSSRLTKSACQSSNLSVTVWVTGGSTASVKKAVDELQKIFSGACDTKKINMEGIGSLSDMQINHLKQEAYRCDMEITVDKTAKCITVCGYSAAILDMVSKITDEIGKGIKKEKQKQEADNALMVSKVVEWSYTARGQKLLFDKKTNAQLEMAHSKSESTAKVSINGKEFTIDLQAKTGRGNGEQITVTRTPKEGNQGVPLPKNWTPMQSTDVVLTVPLNPADPEYQNVLGNFQATGGAAYVQKIERVQNPRLYRTYIVEKQEMDKNTGGNSERMLFHGTDGKNISKINTQGFNRIFGGVHGLALGHGVYFAKNASYSRDYTGSSGGGYMYLARVLVGDYCQGRSGMLTPDPKNHSRPDILYDSVVDNPQNPTIFVVFSDPRCYPEYLITF